MPDPKQLHEFHVAFCFANRRRVEFPVAAYDYDGAVTIGLANLKTFPYNRMIDKPWPYGEGFKVEVSYSGVAPAEEPDLNDPEVRKAMIEMHGGSADY